MAVRKQKSESVSQPSGVARHGIDERVRRTRARIDAALVELLQRRAYGNIRVSDIVKKAGVGRPTFYAHYATKDALLRSQFERIVSPMIRPLPAHPARMDATYFFAHVGSAPHLYRAMMGPNGGTAPRVIRDCVERHVRQVLGLSQTGDSGLKHAATARFVAASLMSIVECWLEQGARETPQQVQELFASLVGPGLKL